MIYGQSLTIAFAPGAQKPLQAWLDVASNGNDVLLKVTNFRIGATIILYGSAETDKIGHGRFSITSGADWPNSKQEGTFSLSITKTGTDAHAELSVTFPGAGGPYTIKGEGSESDLSDPKPYTGRAISYTRIIYPQAEQ
ncbi:hypothetical protein SISNIDRAFT_457927 [Sistotremastrum niveocremeum HHB9708]|uniref:Uncharacterized protein n=2 Tax=Sistotremastraceae TaxID=3402574 RepID=A0A164QX65_9AGAM|nr:hypothetical protein SISNIDRAFT_457927 [Sistotremastrum niveocremeum HHB9708]KZT31737.1 hypothetical protein SISSUDRAFT_1056316 [Sistotremastrum suecicum HHB10207 ss-3]